VIHDGMPYDPIQGQRQGHRGPKVVKMANFKVCLPCQYACSQKTNGELLILYNQPEWHSIA